jgi:hypothetical protein
LTLDIDDQLYFFFSFDDFFLSYGIHKYVIIIAITYVLNNE